MRCFFAEKFSLVRTMAEEAKERLTKILQALSVPDRKIKNTVKDNKLVTSLAEVFNEAGITESSKISAPTLELLMEVAFKFPAAAPKNRSMLVQSVLQEKVGPVQVDLALKYFKKVLDGPYDTADYEKTCGIGVKMTEAEIKAGLQKILADHKDEFGPEPEKQQGLIWKYVKQTMPFADSTEVKGVLNQLFSSQKEDHTRQPGSIYFPKPEENTQQTPELLAQHLKETGGRVITRFPPEPNGYLHIGHAKAMHLNFGYAKKMGGMCIMRFDDTNPETESPEYVNSIADNVQWMGHKWDKLTYASDYFQQLYDLAIELIKRGKAYVCHQTGEEIEASRATHTNSPWRDRSVEENLKLFQDMKHGKFAEGTATLRMKMNMQSDKSVFWDLVAYRVKHIPHHRTSDKWCIYPSYDYTHCLNDTLENITHSLCTVEFVPRRDSYNWLVDSLGLYRSVVWEYARLNLTYTVLSKRKLIQLVTGKHVNGWDDPRLSTINGLRRRGYSPDGINNFCESIGVTRNNSVIPIEMLEEYVRQDLNKTSRRCFAVFNPVKATIRNWTAGSVAYKCPNVPEVPERGEHTVQFDGTFFIEKTDYREVDEKDYFGLALKTDKQKYVKLRYVNVDVKLVDIIKDANGEVVELILEQDPKGNTKHAIHWVPVQGAVKVEVRNYERLFLSEDPVKKYDKDWLKDLNPNSLTLATAWADPSVKDLKAYDRIQFERQGYYCVDPDTSKDHVVVNRTVNLKESTWKKQQK